MFGFPHRPTSRHCMVLPSISARGRTSSDFGFCYVKVSLYSLRGPTVRRGHHWQVSQLSSLLDERTGKKTHFYRISGHQCNLWTPNHNATKIFGLPQSWWNMKYRRRKTPEKPPIFQYLTKNSHYPANSVGVTITFYERVFHQLSKNVPHIGWCG